jgi:hypothetical protein
MHPHSYRFIHIDIGLTQDKLGMGAVFASSDRSNLYRDPDGVVDHTERLYFCDWCVAIKAKAGQEVPLHKVREFLILLKRFGYPILCVSSDQYQSKDLRQQLKLEGFETDEISTDRTRDLYIAMKASVLRERLLLPNHSLLKNELVNLKDDGKKVDHPANGSKDVADGVCGAYWSCYNTKRVVSPVAMLNATEGPRPVIEIREGFQKKQLEETAKKLFWKGY